MDTTIVHKNDYSFPMVQWVCKQFDHNIVNKVFKKCSVHSSLDHLSANNLILNHSCGKCHRVINMSTFRIGVLIQNLMFIIIEHLISIIFVIRSWITMLVRDLRQVFTIMTSCNILTHVISMITSNTCLEMARHSTRLSRASQPQSMHFLRHRCTLRWDTTWLMLDNWWLVQLLGWFFQTRCMQRWHLLKRWRRIQVDWMIVHVLYVLVLFTALLLLFSSRHQPPSLFLPLLSREWRFIYTNDQTMICQQAWYDLCDHESLCIESGVIVVDRLWIKKRFAQSQFISHYFANDIHRRDFLQSITTHLALDLLKRDIYLTKLVERTLHCIYHHRITFLRDYPIMKDLLFPKSTHLTYLDIDQLCNHIQRQLFSTWAIYLYRFQRLDPMSLCDRFGITLIKCFSTTILHQIMILLRKQFAGDLRISGGKQLL